MAYELRTTRETRVGLAFPVKDPQWAGDAYTRDVQNPGHIAINTDILGRDGVTFTITFNGFPIANMNKADAEAFAIALLRATD